MPRLFCFGLGYTAQRLTAVLQAEGWRVSGTSRSAETRAALAARGIETFDFPLQDASAALKGASHILSTVPPDTAGDPVLREHGGDLPNARPKWLGYLSTTGVYGDRGGDWVNEDSATRPTSDRGRRRLEAEGAWMALRDSHGLPVHIFRLPGIYGPGRSAIDAVRHGRAHRVLKPGQVFSRIHVDDIVQALQASKTRPKPGAIYNVADDHPAPAHEVVEYACALLGVDPPPLLPIEDARLSPMALDFYADNKRVSNARMKRELGVELRYPDYRSGLNAIFSETGGWTAAVINGE